MAQFNPYVPPKKEKKRGRKPKPKPQPKKVGRKRIKRKFDEVPLGYSLRLNAPLEFDLVMQVVGLNGTPEADLVEAISYSSKNPYFRSEDFRRRLILYRNEGCYAEHPKKTPKPSTIASAAKRRKVWQKDESEKV